MKQDFDLYNLLISRLLDHDDLAFINDIIKDPETQQAVESTEQITKNKKSYSEDEHKEHEVHNSQQPINQQ